MNGSGPLFDTSWRGALALALSSTGLIFPKIYPFFYLSERLIQSPLVQPCSTFAQLKPTWSTFPKIIFPRSVYKNTKKIKTEPDSSRFGPDSLFHYYHIIIPTPTPYFTMLLSSIGPSINHFSPSLSLKYSSLHATFLVIRLYPSPSSFFRPLIPCCCNNLPSRQPRKSPASSPHNPSRKAPLVLRAHVLQKFTQLSTI